jgi:hypothetical protein
MRTSTTVAALLPACAVWTVGSVVATALYARAPEAAASYHGMASSITFVAPSLAMLLADTPTPAVGAVAYVSARLTVVSFRFWEVHRFYAWSPDAQAAHAGGDKQLLNHADPHAMLAVACGAVGLCVEHLARATAVARARAARRSASRPRARPRYWCSWRSGRASRRRATPSAPRSPRPSPPSARCTP